MLRKNHFILLGAAVLMLVASAGCTGTMGFGGPTISDVETGVTSDNTPYLAFHYSVDDYATAILEGPNGNIVNEQKLSPNNNATAFRFANPRPGTYTVAIQQSGDTAATKEVEFSGPEMSISSTEVNWMGARIQSIKVTIENNGDLPERVKKATASARGDTIENSPLYVWIDGNSSKTITIEQDYGSSIAVERPGRVQGQIEVETRNQTLFKSFSKTFEGPQIKIRDIEQSWNGNEFRSLSATVENIGDMTASVNVSIYQNDDLIEYSGIKTVQPESYRHIEITDSWLEYLYRAESGGTHQFTVVVNTESSHATKYINHSVNGSELTFNSLNPSWENGKLSSVTVGVTNNGDVESDADIEILVNGEVVSSGDALIEPGASQKLTFESTGFDYGPLYTAESGGEYEVTAKVVGKDATISSSTTFKGIDASVSKVETAFHSNYDSNTSDLSYVEFRIRNTGDIALTYDSIETTIDGVTRSTSVIEQSLEPGESRSEMATYLSDITVDDGTHELTVKVKSNGKIIATATETVST